MLGVDYGGVVRGYSFLPQHAGRKHKPDNNADIGMNGDDKRPRQAVSGAKAPKLCFVCHAEKQASEFSRNQLGKGGKARCIVCVAASENGSH